MAASLRSCWARHVAALSRGRSAGTSPGAVRALSKFWHDRFEGKHKMEPRWEGDCREHILDFNWGYMCAEMKEQIWQEWKAAPTRETLETLCRELRLSLGTVRAAIKLRKNYHENIEPHLTQEEKDELWQLEAAKELMYHKSSLDFLYSHPSLKPEDYERIPELLRFRDIGERIDNRTYDSNYYFGDDDVFGEEALFGVDDKEIPITRSAKDVVKDGKTMNDILKWAKAENATEASADGETFEDGAQEGKGAPKPAQDASLGVPIPTDEGDVAWRGELETIVAAHKPKLVNKKTRGGSILVFRDTSKGAPNAPSEISVREPFKELRKGTRRETVLRSWVPKRPGLMGPAETSQGYSRQLVGRHGEARSKAWPAKARRLKSRMGL
eukprot:scaffold1944_cov241-Pinguiococcus_pyrenoidosus.AAC.12